MALPSSAMRVASSSSDTTSSPRSGSSSKGGGTRRGVPGIAGTLATAGALSVVGTRRRLHPEATGGSPHLPPPAHLGALGLAPGHGQHPLDGGGVGRIGAAEPRQPRPHRPAG